MEEILSDYTLALRIFPEDKELKMTRDSLRLCSSTVSSKNNLLSTELIGRLHHLAKDPQNPHLASLVHQSQVWAEKNHFPFPTNLCFQPPGGYLRSTLDGHSSSITFSAFSPDSRNIVSATGLSIRIWDTDSGSLIHDVERYGGTYIGLFSPSNPWFFFFSNPSMIPRCISLETGDVPLEFEGAGSLVTFKREFMVVSEKGDLLVAGPADSKFGLSQGMVVWDAKTGALLSFLPSKDCYTAAISSCGRWIAVSSVHSLDLYCQQTFQKLASFVDPSFAFKQLFFVGEMLYAPPLVFECDKMKAIELLSKPVFIQQNSFWTSAPSTPGLFFNLQNPSESIQLPPETETLTDLIFIPNRFVLSRRNSLLFEWKTGSKINCPKDIPFRFSPSFKFGTLGLSNGKEQVLVYDLDRLVDNQNETQNVQESSSHIFSPFFMEKDGKLLVFNHQFVFLYDLESGELLDAMNKQTCLACYPGNKRLFATKPQSDQLWEISLEEAKLTLVPVGTFEGLKTSKSAPPLAFSRYGRYVCLTRFDGKHIFSFPEISFVAKGKIGNILKNPPEGLDLEELKSLEMSPPKGASVAGDRQVSLSPDQVIVSPANKEDAQEELVLPCFPPVAKFEALLGASNSLVAVLTSASDKTQMVEVLNLESGQRLILEGLSPKDPCTLCAFASEDGLLLLSFGSTSILVFDTLTGRLHMDLEIHHQIRAAFPFNSKSSSPSESARCFLLLEESKVAILSLPRTLQEETWGYQLSPREGKGEVALKVERTLIPKGPDPSETQLRFLEGLTKETSGAVEALLEIDLSGLLLSEKEFLPLVQTLLSENSHHKLTSLDLSFNSLWKGATKEGVQLLSELPSLTSLNLTQNGLKSGHLELFFSSLAARPSHPLKELILRENPLGPMFSQVLGGEPFGKISSSPFQLCKLDLSFCGLTAEGTISSLQKLSALGVLQELELGLEGNGVPQEQFPLAVDCGRGRVCKMVVVGQEGAAWKQGEPLPCFFSLSRATDEFPSFDPSLQRLVSFVCHSPSISDLQLVNYPDFPGPSSHLKKLIWHSDSSIPFPEELKQLTSLEEIEISDSWFLEDLPSLSVLSNLTKVSLSMPQYRGQPLDWASLGFLPQLRSLSIRFADRNKQSSPFGSLLPALREGAPQLQSLSLLFKADEKMATDATVLLRERPKIQNFDISLQETCPEELLDALEGLEALSSMMLYWIKELPATSLKKLGSIFQKHSSLKTAVLSGPAALDPSSPTAFSESLRGNNALEKFIWLKCPDPHVAEFFASDPSFLPSLEVAYLSPKIKIPLRQLRKGETKSLNFEGDLSSGVAFFEKLVLPPSLGSGISLEIKVGTLSAVGRLLRANVLSDLVLKTPTLPQEEVEQVISFLGEAKLLRSLQLVHENLQLDFGYISVFLRGLLPLAKTLRVLSIKAGAGLQIDPQPLIQFLNEPENSLSELSLSISLEEEEPLSNLLKAISKIPALQVLDMGLSKGSLANGSVLGEILGHPKLEKINLLGLSASNCFPQCLASLRGNPVLRELSMFRPLSEQHEERKSFFEGLFASGSRCSLSFLAIPAILGTGRALPALVSAVRSSSSLKGFSLVDYEQQDLLPLFQAIAESNTIESLEMWVASSFDIQATLSYQKIGKALRHKKNFQSLTLSRLEAREILAHLPNLKGLVLPLHHSSLIECLPSLSSLTSLETETPGVTPGLEGFLQKTTTLKSLRLPFFRMGLPCLARALEQSGTVTHLDLTAKQDPFNLAFYGDQGVSTLKEDLTLRHLNYIVTGELSQEVNYGILPSFGTEQILEKMKEKDEERVALKERRTSDLKTLPPRQRTFSRTGKSPSLNTKEQKGEERGEAKGGAKGQEQGPREDSEIKSRSEKLYLALLNGRFPAFHLPEDSSKEETKMVIKALEQGSSVSVLEVPGEGFGDELDHSLARAIFSPSSNVSVVINGFPKFLLNRNPSQARKEEPKSYFLKAFSSSIPQKQSLLIPYLQVERLKNVPEESSLHLSHKVPSSFLALLREVLHSRKGLTSLRLGLLPRKEEEEAGFEQELEEMQETLFQGSASTLEEVALLFLSSFSEKHLKQTFSSLPLLSSLSSLTLSSLPPSSPSLFQALSVSLRELKGRPPLSLSFTPCPPEEVLQHQEGLTSLLKEPDLQLQSLSFIFGGNSTPQSLEGLALALFPLPSLKALEVFHVGLNKPSSINMELWKESNNPKETSSHFEKLNMHPELAVVLLLASLHASLRLPCIFFQGGEDNYSPWVPSTFLKLLSRLPKEQIPPSIKYKNFPMEKAEQFLSEAEISSLQGVQSGTIFSSQGDEMKPGMERLFGDSLEQLVTFKIVIPKSSVSWLLGFKSLSVLSLSSSFPSEESTILEEVLSQLPIRTLFLQDSWATKEFYIRSLAKGLSCTTTLCHLQMEGKGLEGAQEKTLSSSLASCRSLLFFGSLCGSLDLLPLLQAVAQRGLACSLRAMDPSQGMSFSAFSSLVESWETEGKGEGKMGQFLLVSDGPSLASYKEAISPVSFHSTSPPVKSIFPDLSLLSTLSFLSVPMTKEDHPLEELLNLPSLKRCQLPANKKVEEGLRQVKLTKGLEEMEFSSSISFTFLEALILFLKRKEVAALNKIRLVPPRFGSDQLVSLAAEVGVAVEFISRSSVQ